MNAIEPTPQSHAQDTELIDLADLLRTLNRYKWSIVSITLLFAVAAGLATFIMDPIYRATTTLMIESTKERVAPVAEVYDPGVGRLDYFLTQYQLMQSRGLATQLVDKLDLAHDPEFETEPPPAWLDWRSWLPFLPPPPTRSQEQIDAQHREDVINQVLSRITVEPISGTQLVYLSFDAHSPQLAQNVANTLAELYINSGLQSRLDATRRANAWLTEKLADIRVELEKSEKALQEFRDQEQLVNVGGERTLSEDQLLDANRRLRDAQKHKTDLASAYWKIKQAGDDAEQLQQIGLLLSDSRVNRAYEAFLSAQETVKQMLQRYGEKHPAMANAQAKLDGARAAYTEQLRIAAQGVKADYEIAEQTERLLTAQVNSAREEIKSLDEKQYDLGVLEREVQTNRDIYNMFLTRFKQTDTLDSSSELARVTDQAIVPRVRYAPSFKRYVVIAGVIGFMAGLLLTLLRYLLSEEIRSPEELEGLTGAPILGVLPIVDRPDRRKIATLFVTKPKIPYVEGIRSVRTALQLSDVDRKYKNLLVTSSVPQEGKSSFICGLAMSFAAIEQVLLIDADLRRPTLRKALGLPDRARGLTDVLAGQATLEECLHLDQASGLYVLPAGTMVPNPAEVLASQAFTSLVEKLSQRFSRIFFDTPPCHAASDALLLSRHADGVIFVVRSDSTSRRAIRNSFKLLHNVGAPILGAVVDQVDPKKNRSFYHTYYYASEYNS